MSCRVYKKKRQILTHEKIPLGCACENKNAEEETRTWEEHFTQSVLEFPGILRGSIKLVLKGFIPLLLVERALSRARLLKCSSFFFFVGPSL